jgi:hypothetical protein
MTDPHLPWLEPPPGGLTRLRARLDAEERRAHRRHTWAWSLPAAAALALLLLWLAWPAPAPPPPSPLAAADLPALAALRASSPRPPGVQARDPAALTVAPVPITSPRVLYYRALPLRAP